jgi:pimeloyl-ACP methyl ester carboxylesterase
MMNTGPARTPAELVGEIDARSRRATTGFMGGGSMHWRIWGSGPALVLLHGGYGSWRHYLRNIEPLSRDFTVVVPDMPGFGDSDPPPEAASVDWMAETVAAGAREVLGSGVDFGVVGFSFGSVISSHMPAFAAGRMRQLIVVAYNRLGLWELRRPPMRNWRKARTRDELEAAQRFNLGALLIYDPARIDDLAVHLQIENTRRSRIRSLDVAKSHDLPARLQGAGIPVAAIWGEHDVTLVTGIGDATAAFARLVPGAPMVVIDGVGHWVQYEAADAFNRAVRDLAAVPR